MGGWCYVKEIVMPSHAEYLLHEEGILARRHDGNTIVYNLTDPTLPDLCALVCGRIEDVVKAEVRRLGR